MADHRVDLLGAMLRESGFTELRSGDRRPWIRYVRAVKPSGGG
jgi:hypothetical protein